MGSIFEIFFFGGGDKGQIPVAKFKERIRKVFTKRIKVINVMYDLGKYCTFSFKI